MVILFVRMYQMIRCSQRTAHYPEGLMNRARKIRKSLIFFGILTIFLIATPNYSDARTGGGFGGGRAGIGRGAGGGYGGRYGAVRGYSGRVGYSGRAGFYGGRAYGGRGYYGGGYGGRGYYGRGYGRGYYGYGRWGRGGWWWPGYYGWWPGYYGWGPGYYAGWSYPYYSDYGYYSRSTPVVVEEQARPAPPPAPAYKRDRN